MSTFSLKVKITMVNKVTKDKVRDKDRLRCGTFDPTHGPRLNGFKAST
jgi:hypothetical protein